MKKSDGETSLPCGAANTRANTTPSLSLFGACINFCLDGQDMGPSLVIFVSVCFNLRSITKGFNAPDPRYEVLKGVIGELRRRGHTVLIRAVTEPARRLRQIKQLHDPVYGEYDAKNTNLPKVDAKIMWWAYRGDEPTGKKRIIPTVVFENGFTRGDVTVDPSGLLGSSFYLHSLNRIVQKDYNDKTCLDYIKNKVKKGWSKRPQNETISTAEQITNPQILGKYIFIPTQKMKDLSITQYSNTSMPAFLRKTAHFCTDHNLPMVVKIHPHLKNKEQKRQRYILHQKLSSSIITPTIKNKNKNNNLPSPILLSNTSIGFLTKHAKFTAVLNAGTIVDALYMQAPILATAINLFAYTDAIVFDPDVKRGLDTINTIIDMDGWKSSHKLRQRQVICWLARASMNMDYSPNINIAILEHHFANKYPGFSLDGPYLNSSPSHGALPPLRRFSSPELS